MSSGCVNKDLIVHTSFQTVDVLYMASVEKAFSVLIQKTTASSTSLPPDNILVGRLGQNA